MAPSPEHDYIGSAKISSSFESSSDYLVDGNGVNLRETELRLGLPGSGSPKRQDKLGMAFGLQQPKSFAFGSKRGFSDAIHGNVELDFPGCGGSNVENEKGGILFSLRRVGSGGGAGMHSVGVGNDVSGKAIPLPEKKTQGSVKAQAVGWPPIRSYRKNTLAAIPSKNIDEKDGGCLYVKVSMDGAPYLRKVGLKTYCNYKELSSALEKMFSGFTFGKWASKEKIEGMSECPLADQFLGYEYVLTYEDKDGDWMLVGDVPWDMFIDSCKRLRIMKGSDAIGLAPRAMEKNTNPK